MTSKQTPDDPYKRRRNTLLGGDSEPKPARLAKADAQPIPDAYSFDQAGTPEPVKPKTMDDLIAQAAPVLYGKKEKAARTEEPEREEGIQYEHLKQEEVENLLDAYQGDRAEFEFLTERYVRRQLEIGWATSNPDARKKEEKKEQGGWIVKPTFWDRLFNRDEGRGYIVTHRPAGTIGKMGPMGDKPEGAIAWWHTHPGQAYEGFGAGGSTNDQLFSDVHNLPGVVMTHEGLKFITPRHGKSEK